MTDIRIKILVFIKQGYLLSDVVRFGMGRGSTFVAVGIDQFFDHFIFFLFIHCQYDLSDNADLAFTR